MQTLSLKLAKKYLIFLLLFNVLDLWPLPAFAGCWQKVDNQDCKIWKDNCSDSSKVKEKLCWVGECIAGVVHGAGEIIATQEDLTVTNHYYETFYGALNSSSVFEVNAGIKYIGENKNGSFHGFGVLLKPNGDKYIGSFENGVPHGKLTYLQNNRIVYQGTWIQGKRQGQGIQYEPNGTWYEGEFSNGAKHGSGIEHQIDKTIEGSWLNGRLEGQASIQFTNGTKVTVTFSASQATNHAQIIYPNGDLYEGSITTDTLAKNGPGILHYNNGDIFEGSWANGARQGPGKKTFADGRSLTCQWTEDRISESEVCQVRFPNGDLYSGVLMNNLRHGVGKQIYSTGEIYDGQWRSNLKDGEGSFTFANGDNYTGHWVAGNKSGTGVFTLATGASYNGQWQNNERTGQGTYLFPDGSRYEGTWQNDKRHGRGSFHFIDGSWFEGEWKQGTISGYGQFHYANGNYYIGDWQKNKKDGTGKFIWNDGSSYEGTWVEDAPDGHGTFKRPTGEYFSGAWEKGIAHGTGVYRYANGDTYDGEWQYGEKSGQGVYSFSNGNEYEGEFEGGQPNGVGVFRFTSGNWYEGNFQNGKFKGEGSLYINQEGAQVVFTGIWDGTNTLPHHGSILFANGDLFEGELDGGQPTLNGRWSTLEERERQAVLSKSQADLPTLEEPEQKIVSVQPQDSLSTLQESKQQPVTTQPHNDDSVTSDLKTAARNANDFYKKHKETISKAVFIANATLTVLSFTPAAPLAAPTLMAINLIDASVNTASTSVEIADAIEDGNTVKAQELGKELASNLAENAIFSSVPMLASLKQPAKSLVKKSKSAAIKALSWSGERLADIRNKFKLERIPKFAETTKSSSVRGPPQSAGVESSKLVAKEKTIQEFAPKTRRATISEEAARLQNLPKIRLTDEKFAEIKDDLVGAIKKYTESGTATEGFEEFFARLSPDRAKQLLEDQSVRIQVAGFIRSPGGEHEWLMVKHLADFVGKKNLGPDRYKYIASIKKLRNATEDIVFKQGGMHGSTGSTAWHNGLSKRIQGALAENKSFDEVVEIINKYAQATLESNSYKKFSEIWI